MFDLRKIFDLRKFFAVPKNFLKSKIHCISKESPRDFFIGPLIRTVVQTEKKMNLSFGFGCMKN
jgi:hypothetical protein